MQLNPVSTTFTPAEDQTWLASGDGTAWTESITLDTSAFGTTPFPGHLVKSGTVLGKITASGKWGPYQSDASDGREIPIGFLFTTKDLTNDNQVAAGADASGALLTRGKIVAAKVPQGTGASSTTPGALDSVATTYPAALTTAQQRAVAAFLAKFRVI